MLAYFHCQGVGQGSTVRVMVADGGCLDIFLSTIYLFMLPLSERRLNID